ncbi:TAXI family TRAP transporter solute-binding subunit [Roseospira goensis]|uniref:TRAP transporter TAXI family solute receptor n=1 Tax=Roseospira goensis TaxID=391922 RepID=A0A7W6RXB5_9PROT|nr:TAXI family TRAP transporter solute-binding subunit [Roseospira goensis]MBB4284959.1 TRAP transporter TAXI family solute receptor [Roseospira goensis]
MTFVRKLALGLAVTAGLGLATVAQAQERVTLKSAKSTSSYYVMMVQLAEMTRKASDGAISPTVEESQGSVQNVKESFVRPGNFLFTTPPSLLAAARAGDAPFEGQTNDDARTLFVMPFVTIHFVVTADGGIDSVSDLAGKTFIAGGKGTFCEKRTNTILDLLGLADQVEIVEVELSAAGDAMRDGKVDGFATCSAHPTPQLVELSTTTPVKILSFTDAERERILELDPLSGPLTIAAGTYEGQDAPVDTVGVPVGAYGTVRMSDDVAYFLTKTFWEWKETLAQENPWWDGVTRDLIVQMGAKVHPGALRYYEEQGVSIPDDMK